MAVAACSEQLPDGERPESHATETAEGVPRQQPPEADQQRFEASAPPRTAALLDPIREDLVARFRANAPADDVVRFDALHGSSDPAQHERACEMVLLSLPARQLFALGVTAVDQPGRVDWAVGWTADSGPGYDAVNRVLRNARLVAGASCSLGRCGWYVKREQFFDARRALLADDEVRRLDVHVVTPRASD